MKKNIIFIAFLGILIFSPTVHAAQTTPQYFTATAPETKSVATNGGNTAATINIDTGVLSTAFTPGFSMTTNSRCPDQLTLFATTTTQSGSQNAIFNIGLLKYIILTNSTTPPPLSSLTDIKSGSATAVNNPNAIAYPINNPVPTSGQLTVAYNSTNKNWDLVLTHRGTTLTSITVPAGPPLSNTYSADDEAGSYQAIVTLSFI